MADKLEIRNVEIRRSGMEAFSCQRSAFSDGWNIGMVESAKSDKLGI